MKIFVYDLDQTLIDSSHRYRNLPSGSIDLPYWIKNATPENIAKDSLLPLAKHYQAALANPAIYVIVATARAMGASDYAYLYNKLGKPDYIISRQGQADRRPDAVLKVNGLRKLFNLKQFQTATKVFWDDNPINLKAVACLHVRCIACNAS